MLDSSEVMITIVDGHHNYRYMKYLKAYPNGYVKVVTENLKDHNFNITDIQLESKVLNKLIQYCKATVRKRINAGSYIAEDDRRGMDAYQLKYHTKWLGIDKVEYGVDLYDYFEEEHDNAIIRGIIENFRFGGFVRDFEPVEIKSAGDGNSASNGSDSYLESFESPDVNF